MISETMENTIDAMFSSEAATNNPPNQDKLVPSHSTHLTQFGFILWGIVLLFTNFTPSPLSKCWQAKGKSLQSALSPLGTAKFAENHVAC